MNKVLDVQNLHVSFDTYAGEVKAVRGVTFSLSEGEVLAIVGESGFGKSVTAKTIMKLIRTNGKISGYQLSDGTVLSKADGVALAKQGGIRGVAIASRNGSEYLRSIPDGKESNNLGDLPSTGLRGLS